MPFIDQLGKVQIDDFAPNHIGHQDRIVLTNIYPFREAGGDNFLDTLTVDFLHENIAGITIQPQAEYQDQDPDANIGITNHWPDDVCTYAMYTLGYASLTPQVDSIQLRKGSEFVPHQTP